MILKVILLSLFGLILISPSAVMASEVRIDDLVVTLPEGYRHEPKSGDDSSVGIIHTKEPVLQIDYDIGIMAGGRFGLVNMLKPDLAVVVYFEEISLGDLQAYFIAFRIGDSAKKRRLFLNIPSVRAHLSVDLDDPSAIAGAKIAFQRIQYRKFVQK